MRWLFAPLTLAALIAGTWRLGADVWPGAVFLGISACWQAVRADVAAQLGVGFEASSRRDAALMQAVGAATVMLPLVYVATGFPWVANYHAPLILPIAGTCLGVAGVVLFIAAHRALGRYWSPTTRLRSDHRLIRQGVFRHIRHPMYAAFLLIAAAQALLLSNWIVGSLGLVAVIALYRHRIPREENMMLWNFGPDWLVYAAQTPRLVPRLRRRAK
jgi:protein-S-isoprenylcysteine O-methyltransferase Ste14